MANIYGRQIILPLTNKSGGSVAAGDVVINDTSNDAAFTTTTSASTTGPVWIAQEAIANNATGRVLIGGYAGLVNVNASVTRGHYGATHTVAKQAADAGTTRTAGTFCRFLTGGTTPTAYVYPTDLLGSSLTNPMTTTGDTIYSSDNSGTPARLGIGSTGDVHTIVGGVPVWRGGQGVIGYVLLKDIQTANTQGGGFTSGAWRTRVLNTESVDTGNDCSLASNQFTLTAGTYDIEASAPGVFVSDHQTRLYNTTDSATILAGTSEYAPIVSSSDGSQTRSYVIGRFTIAASKALELQHRCSVTRNSNGFGVAANFGENEVYAVVRLWRVS